MYHLPSYYDILNTPGTFEDLDLYEKIAHRFSTVSYTHLTLPTIYSV